MSTAVALFDKPQTLPAYIAASPMAKVLAAQLAGGVTSGSINRISLRNGKFRFIKAGVEVGQFKGDALPVVIIAANPHVGRIYYAKAFDADSQEKPDCYSIDGKTSAVDARNRQNVLCATCKQNAVGSSTKGDQKGRACAFKKRVVVVSDSAIGGDAYAMDVGAMSLFGDEEPAQKLFNYKSYTAALATHNLFIAAVVTHLSFDDEATVPKLFFTPARVLDATEWAAVESRVTQDDVKAMLDDVQNEAEITPSSAGTSSTATTSVAPASPTPAAAAPAPAPAPAAATPAPAPRRTRKAPAAASAPTETAGFAGSAAMAPAAGQQGFGTTAAPPVAQAAPVAEAAAGGGGFSIDMGDFDD